MAGQTTPSTEERVDEVRQLRGCLNDLVSLLTLPAMWSEREPPQILDTLLDALMGMMRLDFVYVRLNAEANTLPLEAIRLAHYQAPQQPQALGQALASWLAVDPAASPLSVANPAGGGKVNLARFALGLQEEVGVFVAGSGRADFPTETESFLLRVAANQAAIALRGAQLESQRKQAELGLREQTEVVETINRIGQTLSAELDQHKLVQALTQAATELTGAKFGAYFYNVSDERGEAYRLYTLSGVPLEAFAHFPMPRSTDIFGPTFHGQGVIRLADVKQDPRYGKNSPYYGMPPGHLPVTSYLAVPVVSRSGEVLGGLFFGHTEADVFTERHERIIVGLAAQAAIAMDNARLFELAQRQRAEAQAAQKQVANILESITDSFIVFDHDWRYTFLNREAEKLLLRLQIPSEQALGKKLWEIFPDLIGTELYEQFHHATSAQVPVECEFFYPPLHSWLNLRAYPSPDGLAVYTQDITARKQAEAKLIEQQAQFLTLAESIPQLAWMAGPDGYIHWYNRRWYEYTGTTPEQMEGWGWQSVHDPEVLPSVLQRWQACLASGEPFDMVFPLRGADGVFRPFLTRVMPQRNQQGQIIQWFGTNTDIDEVKRVEVALRHSEQRARFLAQASADFAELTDYKSTLQKVASIAVPAFADWCAVDLLNPDGSLERLAVKHTDPDKVRLAHELMQQYPPHPNDSHGVPYVVRSGTAEMVEEIADALLVELAQDEAHLGIMRELGLKSYICVPMQSKGRMLGVLTFVTAESGRRYHTDDLVAAEDLGRRAAIAIENATLYRALQEADRRKDEFLATLAHELRNPLAPIRTGLHVLKLVKNDPAMAETARAMMERQLHQLVRLVDDLLDVSRITRGKLELRRERVELTTVVQNAVEASRPLIEELGHELIVRLPPLPVLLDADPTRLAQVLQNLLNNAAKYSEPGGHIWLTAEQQHKEIVVRVKDNGIGIPASHLARIFDMFTQVDTALEKAQGGLGIGLSLVKGLVEMHGGKIEAYSDGTGLGSQFVVRLPIVAQRQAPLPEAVERSKEAKRLGAPYRILIVDDNEDSMGWLATMLKIMGNEVRTAHDGEAGIAAAAAFRPDLILMDLGMPKMNGYEAAQRIRREPWGRQPFLVALTGWGAAEDRRRTQAAGFNRHLVKPVDPAEIEKLLAELRTL
ncbi:MAG: GAF domain-containing protein [Acidobacteria bacterium]|nr:GAF domain-containing protein [Acidobacteriota bacterium]